MLKACVTKDESAGEWMPQQRRQRRRLLLSSLSAVSPLSRLLNSQVATATSHRTHRNHLLQQLLSLMKHKIMGGNMMAHIKMAARWIKVADVSVACPIGRLPGSCFPPSPAASPPHTLSLLAACSKYGGKCNLPLPLPLLRERIIKLWPGNSFAWPRTHTHLHTRRLAATIGGNWWPTGQLGEWPTGH